MEVTGADPTGEGTGVRIMDTAGPTLTLRTPDAGGTAGAGYAPEESSFTDALCPVVEESPRCSPHFFHQSEAAFFRNAPVSDLDKQHCQQTCFFL
jgi:hypothetical protein